MLELTSNTILLQNIRNLSVFNYGPNGCGKTFMISTCPSPYVIFTEQPAIGLALNGFPVRGVVVSSLMELLQVTADIVAGRRAKEYETICLDSLSDVTQLAIKDVLKTDREPQRQEWYPIIDRIRRYIINDLIRGVIESAHKHLYVTARSCVKEIDNGSGMKTHVGIPDTVGQFAYMVRGLFHVCGYSESRTIAEKGYCIPAWEMHTITHGLYFAKDLLGICNPVEYYSELKGPSFSKLVEKLNAKREIALQRDK